MTMPTFHSVLTGTARYVYCTSVPDEWRFERLPWIERVLHVVRFGFDVLDFVNLVVDIVFFATLLRSNTFQAVVLCIGVLLARLASRRGNNLQFLGGLYWAPFFCPDPYEYMTSNVERERALLLLYNLVFTELCVFLYEDVTLILVYVFSTASDDIQLDGFDRFNIWTTLLSIVGTIFLLLASIAYSLNLQWCRDKRQVYRQQQRFCDKIKVGSSIGLRLLARLIRAFLFLCCLGLVLFYLSAVLHASILLLIREEGVPSQVRSRLQLAPAGFTGVFFLCAMTSWTAAAYFSCKLRRQSNHPTDVNAILASLQTKDQEEEVEDPSRTDDPEMVVAEAQLVAVIHNPSIYHDSTNINDSHVVAVINNPSICNDTHVDGSTRVDGDPNESV